jgi:glycosyltransferase involved in cell wall biosynthesis
MSERSHSEHKTTTAGRTILIDAREFVSGRRTGIARVLEGLTHALTSPAPDKTIVLATQNPESLPTRLKDSKILKTTAIPRFFLKSEKTLSDLTKGGVNIFISPYPKLPLFGCFCPAVHIIHDVLDLTHPAYKRRVKAFFDGFRLKRALRRADLTWYPSSWSLRETRGYAGIVGRNAKVRFWGIEDAFHPARDDHRDETSRKYQLHPGYVLVLGNGLPHKNLGVLLAIASQTYRRLVCAGVPVKNQAYWKTRYPQTKAVWIEHVPDEDLPSLIRDAFCLAQPSTAEGYGYPPLEAMACGVPAVVSNIPVLVETTGANCLLADPREPMKWAEAFRALENKEVQNLQIEKGLRWVQPLRGREAWQKHVQDIEDLLYASAVVAGSFSPEDASERMRPRPDGKFT